MLRTACVASTTVWAAVQARPLPLVSSCVVVSAHGCRRPRRARRSSVGAEEASAEEVWWHSRNAFPARSAPTTTHSYAQVAHYRAPMRFAKRPKTRAAMVLLPVDSRVFSLRKRRSSSSSFLGRVCETGIWLVVAFAYNDAAYEEHWTGTASLLATPVLDETICAGKTLSSTFPNGSCCIQCVRCLPCLETYDANF